MCTVKYISLFPWVPDKGSLQNTVVLTCYAMLCIETRFTGLKSVGILKPNQTNSQTNKQKTHRKIKILLENFTLFGVKFEKYAKNGRKGNIQINVLIFFLACFKIKVAKTCLCVCDFLKNSDFGQKSISLS